MLTRHRKSRSFEQLETRFALAGNVTASVDGGGNLLITGDSLNNGIELQETSTGHFRLTGVNQSGVATSINGTPNDVVNFTGVTTSITIRMLDGTDDVFLPYFNFAGRIIINDGDNGDGIRLGSDSLPKSYLVGNLSIRSGDKIGSISMRHVNVIGNLDFGADQTDGVNPEHFRFLYTMYDCTVGSGRDCTVGGRGVNLQMDLTHAAGDVFVISKVEETVTQFNQQYVKPVQIERLFGIEYSSSSIAGNLSVDSTLYSQIEVSDSTIIGEASFHSVGSSNSMTFSATSFGSLSTDTHSTYVEPNAVPSLPSTTHTVESSYDDILVQFNTYVSNTLDIRSNGSITVTDTFATEAILTAAYNAHAYISAEDSSFSTLTIALGSVATPNSAPTPSAESSASDYTAAVLDLILVRGLLTFDSRTRLNQAIERVGESLNLTSFINSAQAAYFVTDSTLQAVQFIKQDESAPFSNKPGNIGDTYFDFTRTTMPSITLDLTKANDTVTFNNSNVTQFTRLNGGGGTNYLFNNSSTLNNLEKTNFAN